MKVVMRPAAKQNLDQSQLWYQVLLYDLIWDLSSYEAIQMPLETVPSHRTTYLHTIIRVVKLWIWLGRTGTRQ